MNLCLREAKSEDAAFILKIRNADDVRVWSKNQEAISAATHAKWLETQLQDPKSVLWIIEDELQPLGYIRSHEARERTWRLSFALDRSFRGKGYGRAALRQACDLLIDHYGAQCLLAEVISTNAVVMKLLDKAGFKNKGKTREVGLDIEHFEWCSECYEPVRG